MNMSVLKKGMKKSQVINAVTFGRRDAEEIIESIIERHKSVDCVDSTKAIGVVLLLDQWNIRGKDVVTLCRVVSGGYIMRMVAILLASEHHLAGMSPEKLLDIIQDNTVLTNHRKLLYEVRIMFPEMKLKSGCG